MKFRQEEAMSDCLPSAGLLLSALLILPGSNGFILEVNSQRLNSDTLRANRLAPVVVRFLGLR